MVWGDFGCGGKVNLILSSGYMKATNYQEMLEIYLTFDLLSFSERIACLSCIFRNTTFILQTPP